MALDATVGGVSANSYCTRAEGNAYFDVHLYPGAWATATDAQKDVALQMATRLLDEQVEWDGSIVSSEQALRWPRADVVTPDGLYIASDVIPSWLKNATSELAKWLLTEDRQAERSYGFSEVKADVVQVKFDAADERPLLPDAVVAMVSRYGTVGGGSSLSVPLERV